MEAEVLTGRVGLGSRWTDTAESDGGGQHSSLDEAWWGTDVSEHFKVLV